MIREVGSEFWGTETNKGRAFFLSGRTALEFIIRDILSRAKIDFVVLPSYCCHTMIEPFVRHGIKVRFYDIWVDSERGLCAETPAFEGNGIFYFMTYFGFSKLHGLELERIRKQYPIVIEDKTHSLLSDTSICAADYEYASYRKWSGFYGLAYAKKNNGTFIHVPSHLTNEKYRDMRKLAAARKREYIHTGKGDKQEFLSLFAQAEELLENDYVGYAAPSECLEQLLHFDYSLVSQKRKDNAEVLIKGLKDLPGIELIHRAMDDCDVPLFVPIVVRKGRNELRKHLIENKVYCPVHWPLSDYHNEISSRGVELYDAELSIICDQRYDISDMKHIVDLITDYTKRGC